MRVDHIIADGVNFAVSRRLGGLRALLALLEDGGFRGFFVLLTGQEGKRAIALRASALKSAAEGYSLAKLRRTRSGTNGTVSAANFSFGGIGGEEGAGAGTTAGRV